MRLKKCTELGRMTHNDNVFIHTTLQTAHSRHCGRDEISNDALAFCRELITAALINPNKPVPMPNFDGYFFSGGNISGKGLFGTVWKHKIPMVTIMVAVKSRSSPKLWQKIHQNATLPTKTDINIPPPVPWVVASLTVSAAMDMDAMSWLGDFERCLAWAWMDY
jgi:hypothetical protein